MDGVLNVIAFPTHQNVAICGLSLVLALYSSPRCFDPGSPVSPPPQILTFLNSNSIGCRTSLKTTFG